MSDRVVWPSLEYAISTTISKQDREIRCLHKARSCMKVTKKAQSLYMFLTYFKKFAKAIPKMKYRSQVLIIECSTRLP